MRHSEDRTIIPLPGQLDLFPVPDKENFFYLNGKEIEVPKRPNAFTCPSCGATTRVRCTRPPFRYRYCSTCGKSYRTQEVMQEHADALISLVSTVIGGLNVAGIVPCKPER